MPGFCTGFFPWRGGGGRDIDACNGGMCVSVHPLVVL